MADLQTIARVRCRRIRPLRNALALSAALAAAACPVAAATTVHAAATVRARLIPAGSARGVGARPAIAKVGFSSVQSDSSPAQAFGGLNAPGYSAADELRDSGSVPWPSPPDSTGAIGPHDYVEMVNERIIDYDRSDLSAKWSMDLSDFVGGTTACNPQVKFAPVRNRWFYVAVRCDFTPSANAIYIGFSKTADPSGAWCTYQLPTGDQMYDFPKLGLDGAHLMLGANEADLSNGQFGFETGVIYVFHEATGPITSCPSGLSGTQFGAPGSPLTTAQGNTAWSLEPATVADGLGRGYVVAVDTPPYYGVGANIMLWRVTGTSAPFTLTALGDAPVPPFSVPANIPQPGTEDTLQAYDGRLMMAIAATDPAVGGETIWTVHTVDSGVGGTVVRWYELIPGSRPRARQHGSITDRAGWAFNGAIAPTTAGGAVVNYDVGGPSRTVQIKAQSRIAGTRLGTMNSPITLATSPSIDTDATCQANTATTPCRWGDYAGASLDPTDGSIVWGTNMLNGRPPAGSQNWKAQWKTENFALTPTDLPPTGDFTSSGTSAATPITFTAQASDPDGTIASYGWSFGDGTTTSGASTSHVYGTGGTYSVTLTVTDDGGKTDQITHQVTVVDAPASAPPTSAPVDSNGLTTSVTDAVRVDESPTAALAFAPALPTTGQAVSFDATGADPDGSVADYRWQFGDGGSATGAAPTHTYKTAGTYTVRVGVTDSDGQSATVGRTVTVGAARLARVTVRVGSTREAAIRVTVNAPGTIHGVGKPRPFRAPGTQTLKLRLTRAELRRLNHRARLTVQVTIKFVPVAGPISSRKVTIRFRR